MSIHILKFKLVLGLSEQDAQMIDDTNENNMDNVTQIVLPSPQDKIKKDHPQVHKYILFWQKLMFNINK